MVNEKPEGKSVKKKSMENTEGVLMGMPKKTKNQTVKKEKKMTDKTQSIKKEFTGDLLKLQQVVKDAINNGATSIEQVHQVLAKMPLKYLEKIDRAKKAAKNVGDIQEKTIGHVYDLIRTVNEKVDDIAGDMLRKAAG